MPNAPPERGEHGEFPPPGNTALPEYISLRAEIRQKREVFSGIGRPALLHQLKTANEPTNIQSPLSGY